MDDLWFKVFLIIVALLLILPIIYGVTLPRSLNPQEIGRFLNDLYTYWKEVLSYISQGESGNSTMSRITGVEPSVVGYLPVPHELVSEPDLKSVPAMVFTIFDCVQNGKVEKLEGVA